MKYLLWGPQFEPSYYAIKELFENENVINAGYKGSSFPYYLIKIFRMVPALRGVIRSYFLQRLWKQDIKKEDKAIFIYFEPFHLFFIDSGLLDLFRVQYREALHVVYLEDVVIAKRTDIARLKSNYDMVCIYDADEAKRIGISYAVIKCQYMHYPIPLAEKEIYDVAFVGDAKNRLVDILLAFERLRNLGLRCRFYIVGAEKNERKFEGEEGIQYAMKNISPKEYYESYIFPSKCLLEIANVESDALTMRVTDAVLYGKKVLTNNKKIKTFDYYREDMMLYYQNVDEINRDFFEREKCSYQYKELANDPDSVFAQFLEQYRKRFGNE